LLVKPNHIFPCPPMFICREEVLPLRFLRAPPLLRLAVTRCLPPVSVQID
jgi:hypothetical protein